MELRPIRFIIAITVIFAAVCIAFGQDGPKSTTLSELKNSPPPDTPTTAEVMRERISKAKAYLVVKNYPAAVYELENIRRETNDPTVNRVLNVLLMHAYLEQGDYKKAQKFLTELHKNPAKTLDYFAVAGQVVSGARTQLARYNALGISVSSDGLPVEAKQDLDDMRETLELVVTQSRLISKRKEVAGTALAVLEESSAARGGLARDVYDEKRWKDQVSEAREQLVTPRSKIIDAVERSVEVPAQTPNVTLVAKKVEDEQAKPPVKLEEIPQEVPTESKPVADENTVAINEKKPEELELKPVASETTPPVEKEEKKIQPTDRKVRVIGSAEKKPVDPPAEESEQPDVKSTDQVRKKERVENNVASNEDADAPMTIGSLIAYATKRVNPVYPRQARSMRMEGTVKVEVLIDENGKVAKVENTSGPTLLKRAARDAVRRWKFKPFERDGQPVRATGYVSFNFNL